LSSLAFTGFVIFILLLFAGIYLCLFGLPGTSLIFVSVLVYAFFTDFTQVGWKALLVLLAMVIPAEALDFWMESAGIDKEPVSRQSLWSAFFGGWAGMILLTPFFGGLGIWGGFFLGATSGLLIMEQVRTSKLKNPGQTTSTAFLAMAGRKMIKGFLALLMIFFTLAHIYS